MRAGARISPDSPRRLLPARERINPPVTTQQRVEGYDGHRGAAVLQQSAQAGARRHQCWAPTCTPSVSTLSNATLGVLHPAPHSRFAPLVEDSPPVASTPSMRPSKSTACCPIRRSTSTISAPSGFFVVGVLNLASIVVALDWTDFDADNQATIMLSLIWSHGRATPLVWLVDKRTLKDNPRSLQSIACWCDWPNCYRPNQGVRGRRPRLRRTEALSDAVRGAVL